VFDMLPNPPSTLSPTLYYSNLGSIGSTPGVLFPANLRGFSKEGKVPTTYNWNIGVQHELPFDILLDAAYAGSVSRHLLNQFNVNRPGFGSAFRADTQDPTNANPRFDGTTNLPVNFYRPYQGYGDINITQFGAQSNYNALQLAANRRLAKGLQLGVAYTWSKALGTASGNGDQIHPLNARMGSYAPLTFDRRHYLVFNYVYDVPKLAKGGNALDNIFGRAVFNNWSISGITTMTSGAPQTIGYNISNFSDLNRRMTGDETWGPRVYVLKDPQLGKGERNEYRWIDTSAFAPAAVGSIGLESAARGYLYGPGTHNWDVSVFKNFPFTSDARRMIQLRLEMFNAPNHTQYSGLNTTVTFQAVGSTTVTNLPTAVGGPANNRYGFGAINATRDPRIIQIATKIYF
jgi:hypothetical protein